MVVQDFTERLAALGIQLVAETSAHYLFTRDNCIALVERSLGTIGSTGVLTDQGLAYIIWRDGQAFLKSKSAEIAAGEEQIAAIRQFSQDLATALA
jgi:hypothetical protein